MQMLAFFPWLALKEQVETDYFKTLHYERGTSPEAGTPTQQVIDGILFPYKEGGGRPIGSSTLLLLKNQQLLEELSDEDREEVFTCAELLGFCGLSKRAYFNTLQIGYVNRDDFALYVQSRQENSGAVVVTNRRRDGNKMSIITSDAQNFPRPTHIGANFRVDVDGVLLESLLKARETPNWDRYWESIIGFGRANTDNPATSNETEVVLMVGAFQRLCDVDHNVSSILPVLNRVIPPRKPILPSACPRFTSDQALLQKYGRSNSMLEAWIRDFFAIRGPKGHGRIEVHFKTVWTSEEHLLLGAFLFPLLLKRILAEEDHYTMSQGDLNELDLFEELAAARLFESERIEHDGESWPWNRIHEDACFHRLAEEMYGDLETKAKNGEVQT